MVTASGPQWVIALQRALMRVLATNMKSAVGYGLVVSSGEILDSAAAQFAMEKMTEMLFGLDEGQINRWKLVIGLQVGVIDRIPATAKPDGFDDFFGTVLPVMGRVVGEVEEPQDWMKTWTGAGRVKEGEEKKESKAADALKLVLENLKGISSVFEK